MTLHSTSFEPHRRDMSVLIRVTSLLLLVVFADTLLCLLVPTLVLLELILVFLGGLILAAGVSTLNNLIHYHEVQQALREVELEKQRRQLLPPDHKQISTPHRAQRRSWRLRGPCGQ